MQNWNQWQLSAAAITTPVSQPPIGYTAAVGADPMALMQSYMQYYNQPAPNGYTPEQWAAAQQQGWAQWQQWQQQYQQWQAQYGDKYQETMKHLSMQNMNMMGQTQLPSNAQPPPLPKEDARPPLPPVTINTYQFANMPPPHQNNLPLFPAKQLANKTMSQANVTNYPANPPLPTSQPPLPPEIGENRDNILVEKCDSNVISESNSAKNLKLEDDELSEAEKTFDAQFKQWEEQFNKWKEQNANHPDKTQYKQYEAKWTSWREKLIERREQMRRKREQQKQAAVKAQAEKNKNISGDDKILDILSNTENQRLINNLLGIGKTLGLTGKQNATAPLPPPPPPPPPLPETRNSNNQLTTHETQQISSQVSTIKSNIIASSWSDSQQWINQQYNLRMESSGYGPKMQVSSMSSVPQDVGPPQMISPNFAQPPPNLSNNVAPNFSQPPPNFSNNDRTQMQNAKVSGLVNTKDCSSFGLADPSNTDMRFMHLNDQSTHNFNGQSNLKREGDHERFGRGDRNYSDFGNNQVNSQNSYNLGNDRFGMTDDHFGSSNDRFGKESNRFVPVGNDKLTLGDDRFGSSIDRLDPGSDRFGNEWFGLENDRFRSGIDRLGIDKDHRGSGNDLFGTDSERFGPDRFALSSERFGSGLGIDRFSSSKDRFGPNGEHFRTNDRFGRGNTDYFDPKDIVDHRRDNFAANSRGFNRNTPFSPSNELSPELKKLMEKRKAAGDVFRPSFVDSDKTSSVGSLSESFKKIAGDSPFKSSFDFQKNRGRSANFSNSGPLSFQHPSSDLGQVPTSSFSPRGHSFNRDNELPFRGAPDNFAKHNTMDNERLRKNMESTLQSNQSQPININSQASLKHPGNIKIADSNLSLQTDDIVNTKDAEEIQTNESDKIIKQKDSVISEDSLKKDDNGETSKILGNDNSLQQDGKNHDNNQIQNSIERIDDSGNNNDNAVKKPESLPFMGENDPRPEDLNIEPPPELPNLRPISTDFSQNAPLNPNEDFDGKGPVNNQLDLHFDIFGPRKMEIKSCMPFGSREPPIFDPRGPQIFPMGSISGAFQSQGSVDSQFDLRGPNSNQFGLNASNENRFSPRKINDEQYGGRNPNNESSGDSNSGQFGLRDSMDEQFSEFGSRASRNVKFDLVRFIDRQVGPRGPINWSFAPRNLGPFGARGKDMQFGPRGADNRPDSRTVSEGLFESRGPNDESWGSREPNDMLFGTRRPTDLLVGSMGSNSFGKTSEALFDKRPSFDNCGLFDFSDGRSLAIRRPNERLSDSRNSNDMLLNSRDLNDALLQCNPKSFNENRFESRDSNDKSFGPPDFKTKGSMSDSTDANFPSYEKLFHKRGDYMRRNPYIRRGQFEDNTSVKRTRYENPDEFNRSCSDRNVNIEVRKDSSSEYARHIPDLYERELNETASHSGYALNDTWKDKFSNDQRLDGGQFDVDRNIPNMFDERSKSERITIEPKIKGDYRSRYGESATGSDFQSIYTSNLCIKRSQSRINQEFCVQKQFNYNHGEVDKKFIEAFHFIPVNVIDYGHISRPSNVDQYLSPVQCFDYSHGELKPMMLSSDQQHLHYPKRDFRNWVENEQNLKEYTQKMNNYKNLKGYIEKTRNYETYATNYEPRTSTDKRKENNWQSSDMKSEGERRENDNRKERSYNLDSESRFFECDFGNDQKDRYQNDTNVHKDIRVQEIYESCRRETNKNNDKDDNRSKGCDNWQENSNKNVIDTKLQEISLSPDIKKNVVESTTKSLELAKMSNHTMVDDLLCPPGRQNRPPKIAIILRGPPGSGKSFVAKLIKDKEVEQGGSAPRILSLDDYFLVEKEKESKDDNGKKVTVKEMVYEYEEAMEHSYITSLVKAFKKNITDGFFNFIILDCINEKISDYEEMWSFAKTKGFKVYVCEMEMDLQICLKRNIHNRTEDELNRIIDYFEPTPSYHQKLDVNSMLQEQAIEEVDMEDSQETQEKSDAHNEDSEDSYNNIQDAIGVSKWEKMEAEDKLDRLDGLAKKKSEVKPQTMEDFLQVPDYYNMEDTSGKKRVRWADLEERKEQEKMRAVGFVVGHTNWDRMMDPTKGGSALTRTKFFSLS